MQQVVLVEKLVWVMWVEESVWVMKQAVQVLLVRHQHPWVRAGD